MSHPLLRRLVSEAVGSFFLFATVIGSGIMAERLAGGNVAVALLGNTLATGAILFVLITMLGPLSGAHFNPAVSLIATLRKDISLVVLGGYVVAQLAGGIAGVWTAHVMFDLPVLQVSVKARTGIGQWVGEFVATLGLVLTILGTVKMRERWVPASVALYITAAYWFTSSTSFANPAITIARSLSDSFAGIAPTDVPGFIAAQLAGAIAAHLIARILFGDAGKPRRNHGMSADIIIYHNSECGTSRNVLAMIRNAGIEPHVIEYLKTPPSRAMLEELIARAKIAPRDLLREKGTPFGELGLGDESLSDDRLVDAMMEYPILINRPLVVSPLGVKLCRPSEEVLDLLPSAQLGAFAKEDGEQVVDAHGKRIMAPGTSE